VDRLDTRDLWNANAPAWTELSRAGFDVYRDLVNTPAFFAILPPIDGLRCLDLGCGEGHNTRLLADRGAEVVALDIATAFIDAAAKEAQRGIRYVVGDGSILPFAAGSFDVVTAFNAIQYTADAKAAAGELARTTRPGGRVAIGSWGDPARCETETLFARMRELAPPPPGAPAPPGVATPGVVEDLLGNAGLTVTTTGEVDGPFTYPDLDTAWRGQRAAGPIRR